MELSKIKQLDGIRAIAILLIFICHYCYIELRVNLCGPLLKYTKYSLFWTWSGVDLFFILSGFLIGRILISNKGSKNYFKTFYLKRVFRIFPAYYLIVLLFFVVLLTGLSAYLPWLTQNPFPWYTYLLYIQNFWMVNHGFGPNWLFVTWSLAIEEQFYLLLPLLIFVINEKYRVRFLIFCILLAPVCRYFFQGSASYVMLPARMDSLLAGVLIAHYYLNGKLEKIFTVKRRLLLILMAITFAAVAMLGARKGGEGTGGVFIHSALVFFYGAFMILALTLQEDSWLIRILSKPVMSFLAKISYMAYLTHQVISGILHELILHQAPNLNSLEGVLVTLLALVVTILFSTLSYYCFEKPILNIGKRFKY